MQTPTRRWLWRIAKGLVLLAILVGVGWTFSTHLSELDKSELEWNLVWLVVAGISYLASPVLSCVYWWLILRSLGQRPTFFTALRAYHIGQLGKYVPGKAFVPILRTAYVRGPRVRTGVAVVAVFFESLVILAAGVLLGIALTPAWLPIERERLGLLLLVAAGGMLVLSPPVFNFLARRAIGVFQKHGDEPVRPLSFNMLLLGLGLGVLNSLCVGFSFWASIRAIMPYPLEVGTLAACTSAFCLATVVGFVTPSPGGLGVREWVLLELLTPQLGSGPAAVAPLLLRLTMILAEVTAAGVLYVIPLAGERRVLAPPNMPLPPG